MSASAQKNCQNHAKALSVSCGKLEQQKRNDKDHERWNFWGWRVDSSCDLIQLQIIWRAKSMKVGAKIILTFLVSGKQFFMADFLQKSPKVGFLIPPRGQNLGNLLWVKKPPHLWICHFWPFDALWLDHGSEWWYQKWAVAPLEWLAPGNRGLCYENWAKKARGTFHHNWRDKLNGASQAGTQWRRN